MKLSLSTAGAAFLMLIAASASGAQQVVIGASLPLSGALASFGAFQRWGYERAVAEANAAGGLIVGAKRMQVRLVIRDDQTNAVTSAANVETLISRDRATALLGSCTPALVNAGALVAERHHLPMVTGCDPKHAFTSVRPWRSIWDIFFDEQDLANAPFEALSSVEASTDRRVAILHDNGPDGEVVGGRYWPVLARKYGWTVVVSATFPVDNTQFMSILAQAKAQNADLVLVDATTPQAISIRQQMAAIGYRPKALVMEKGAEPAQFASALGRLADGVLVGGYWDALAGYPGAKDLMLAYQRETGRPASQHIADSYTAAKVLLQAISAAGSLAPAAINAAIGRTDGEFVVGRVRFDARHFARLPIVSMQWQQGATVVVWPAKFATGKLLFPLR